MKYDNGTWITIYMPISIIFSEIISVVNRLLLS